MVGVRLVSLQTISKQVFIQKTTAHIWGLKIGQTPKPRGFSLSLINPVVFPTASGNLPESQSLSGPIDPIAFSCWGTKHTPLTALPFVFFRSLEKKSNIYPVVLDSKVKPTAPGWNSESHPPFFTSKTYNPHSFQPLCELKPRGSHTKR